MGNLRFAGLHARTVLRPEPGGALWFHRDSAETLELDLAGLAELGRWLDGQRARGWKAWQFRCLLLARGFVQPARAPRPADGQRLALCRQAAGRLQAPLRSRVAPEVLHLSLTDACVQRCGGCFFSNREPGRRPNRYFAWADFERLVTLAAEQQVFQLAFGGGEPLMHPRLTEMISLATAAGLVVNLTTSGALLEASRIDALKAAGLGQLQLSLNGSTAERHQRTRPDFAAVIAAAERCRAQHLRFGFNLLIARDSLDDLEAMLALAARLGAWSVNVLRPKPSPAEPDWLAETLPDSRDNRRLQKLLRRWQRRGPFLLQTDTSLTFLRQGSPARLAQAGLGGCSAGRRMLSIGVDGRTSPCSHVPLYDEAADFMHNWRHSDHLERFRRLEDTLKGACGTCELKSVCRGCRAIVWARSGDFDGEDLQCPKL